MRRLFITLATMALTVPVFALNNRSAVSVNGLDTNPCTTASPCRSFTVAIGVTAPGGEIVALDSAGYGAFTISSSMTISGAPGVHAAITVTTPGNDGILISASASDLITITNLALIGPTANHAIEVQQAGDVRVFNCIVTGWTGSAIIATAGRLRVDHCVILDNVNAGVNFNGGSASVEGIVTNCFIDNNDNAVRVLGAASATIAACTIAGSGGSGVFVVSNSGTGQAARVFIESSVLTNNTQAVGLQTAGAPDSAIAYLAQDDIVFTPTAFATVGATAQVVSFGNNRIAEVSTVGAFTTTGLQ